jgi:hypothetical protein
MAFDDVAVTTSYLEHLTDGDLAFLCQRDRGALSAHGGSTDDLRALVRGRRGGIEGLLGRRDTFEALFVADRGSGPLMLVSPFLAFAVSVQRTRVELSSATYVPEWVGVGRRTPVFDVPRLREFVSAPWRCFFLTELLASYSRVASGSVVVATRRGLRRQRFSELDPVRLAGLLDVVPEAERPGVFRRLGDLALFLTGVFPDYVGRRGLSSVDQARLLRSSTASGKRGVMRDEPSRPVVNGDDNAVAMLGQLGRRWYMAAFRLLPAPVPANVAVISEMPERFDDARRILSVIAERFLFPHRDRWFGLPRL